MAQAELPLGRGSMVVQQSCGCAAGWNMLLVQSKENPHAVSAFLARTNLPRGLQPPGNPSPRPRPRPFLPDPDCGTGRLWPLLQNTPYAHTQSSMVGRRSPRSRARPASGASSRAHVSRTRRPSAAVARCRAVPRSSDSSASEYASGVSILLGKVQGAVRQEEETVQVDAQQVVTVGGLRGIRPIEGAQGPRLQMTKVGAWHRTVETTAAYAACPHLPAYSTDWVRSALFAAIRTVPLPSLPPGRKAADPRCPARRGLPRLGPQALQQQEHHDCAALVKQLLLQHPAAWGNSVVQLNMRGSGCARAIQVSAQLHTCRCHERACT